MTYLERRKLEESMSKCLNCKHFKVKANGEKACSNLASSMYGSKLEPGIKCTQFTR